MVRISSLSRDRLKQIFALALPLIGGMTSQNILNLVDTAMVGVLGDAALAAVGMGGFVNFLAGSILLGIGTSVQTIVARRKGEERFAEMAHSLNTALVIILFAGPLLSTLYFLNVPDVFPYLHSDPAVVKEGVPYLSMRVIGITFVALNMSFRGFWNGSDRSKYYMFILIVSHSCNILLNYLLIFGKWGFPELGAQGAGLATTLSLMLATILHFSMAVMRGSHQGFLRKFPGRELFASVFKLSIPSGIQQLMFSAGFTALYWIVGLIGTLELAAANVLINLALVGILPAMAFGLASATLVGKALGRKDPEDAKQWGWDVSKIGFLTLSLVAIVVCAAPVPVLGVFISNPATLKIAMVPLLFMAISLPFEGVGIVLMNSLLGSGDMKTVLRISVVMQWVFFLPTAFLAVTVYEVGLLTIWLFQGGYRLSQSVIFFWFWKRGHWQSIQV